MPSLCLDLRSTQGFQNEGKIGPLRLARDLKRSAYYLKKKKKWFHCGGKSSSSRGGFQPRPGAALIFRSETEPLLLNRVWKKPRVSFQYLQVTLAAASAGICRKERRKCRTKMWLIKKKSIFWRVHIVECMSDQIGFDVITYP